MAVRTETIREVQVLTAFRNPQLIETEYIDSPNGEPLAMDAGYDLESLDTKPTHANVGMRLKEVLGSINGIYRVLTAVDGETYTLVFNASNYDFVAGPADTVETIAAGLLALLGTDPDPFAVVTDNGDGTLSFAGLPSATYTLSATGTTPANSEAFIDATTVDYITWWLLDSGWHHLPTWVRTSVQRNEFERFLIGSAKRVYFEVTSSNGRVRPTLEVGQLEVV